ncbi:MAG: cytochrome b [Mariprofundales bacterium]|nr:cytochrome b [Mariprofundales bacterium]
MMQLRNHATSYGWVTITIHWLMALTIFAMFGLGLWMRTLGYYDSWYHHAPELHKSIGILLLLILIFRLIWRIINTRPDLMGEPWEQIIALLVHRMHYLLLFAVLLTGYLIPTAEGVGIDVFGWFTIPALLSFSKEITDFIGLAHFYIAWGVIALAGAHAAAALKHHVIDKDITLLRMLGVSRETKEKSNKSGAT